MDLQVWHLFLVGPETIRTDKKNESNDQTRSSKHLRIRLVMNLGLKLVIRIEVMTKATFNIDSNRVTTITFRHASRNS